jgi:uncharacterized membrane protein HdeD (DUF308 family)
MKNDNKMYMKFGIGRFAYWKKIVLFVGIILIVIAAVLLIENFSTADIVPAVLGLLGIFVIGVFFLSKKKKWLVSNR